MTTTHIAVEPIQTTASAWRISSLFGNCRDAFQEWRQHEKLRAQLCRLDDRLLADIGMTRDEIELSCCPRIRPTISLRSPASQCAAGRVGGL